MRDIEEIKRDINELTELWATTPNLTQKSWRERLDALLDEAAEVLDQ